jgi:hypothetical protein
MDALDPVAERARQIVPVRSGRLRDDIAVSDQAANGAVEHGVAAYVGPSVDAFYAEDVEYGRPASISASGREHDATRPHPFMRPAWDEEVDGLIDRAAAGIGKLVQRKARG